VNASASPAHAATAISRPKIWRRVWHATAACPPASK
jgi:hypothetical protein